MNNFTFPETKQALQNVFKLLKCNKCSNLPTQKEVFYISSCDHKFCEPCLSQMSGGNCFVCNMKLNIKVKIPDLFSTRLLAKLLDFEKFLNGDANETGTNLYENGIDNNTDFKNTNNDLEPDDDVISVSDMFSLATGEGEKVNYSDTNEQERKLAGKKHVLSSTGIATSFTNNGSTRKSVHPDSGFGVDNFVSVDTQGSPPKLTRQAKASLHSRTPSPHLSFDIMENPDLPILTPHGPVQPTQNHVSLRTKSVGIKKNGKGKFRIELLQQQPGELSAEISEGLSNRPKSKAETILRKLSSASSASTNSTLSGKSSSLRERHSRSSSNTSCESPLSVEKRNSKGETPLIVAARLGKVDRVKQLINAGANINTTDFAGWTPLHEAINGKTTNVLQVVSVLCEAGCHVSIPGMANETPLHEASRRGAIPIINILLKHGANRNIPNQSGQLPRDVALLEEVKAIIDDFHGPTIRDCEFIENRMTEEKYLIFFTYAVHTEELTSFKAGFRGKIASQLSSRVTHVIFDTEPGKFLPLTLDYLLGILSGAWLLSSKWVIDSVCQHECLDPRAYEIHGSETQTHSTSVNEHPHAFPVVEDDSSFLSTIELAGAGNVPKRARTNRELGNPGLFHGINFYLYKNCFYNKFMKKDLAKLITAGDGVVINRDPNPDTVDPLENPIRFHAKDASHKMVLASHVILYIPESSPSKRHNMEHVKTLRVDWLIQSILHFALKDPDVFLN